MPQLSKILILFGAFLIIGGILFFIGSKFGLFGHLPGDFVIRKNNFTFIFPLASSILLSILLTIIYTLVRYFKK
ncbi:MAG: DUF2905 domain-containing protein [Candidatus Zixiibacteriota bacterium]|nr:MAG: DUF2905 domain-containing protein [candidate division Zixibacteria bacterium]